MTDREIAVQVRKKYLRVDDKEILDDAYSFYAQKLQKNPVAHRQAEKFNLR